MKKKLILREGNARRLSEKPTEPNPHIPEQKPQGPLEQPTEPNPHIPEQTPQGPLEQPTEPNPHIPEIPPHDVRFGDCRFKATQLPFTNKT
jgi:hypothetical protein